MRTMLLLSVLALSLLGFSQHGKAGEALPAVAAQLLADGARGNRHGLDGTADKWQLMPASAKRLAHGVNPSRGFLTAQKLRDFRGHQTTCS